MNKKKIKKFIILVNFLIAPILFNAISTFNSFNKSQVNNNNDIDGTLNNLDANDWKVGQIEDYSLNFDSIDNEYIQLENGPLKSIIIDFYNYTSKEVLTTNKIRQYYGEQINISLNYNDTIISEMVYSWFYGNGSILKDPLNSQYYYISINTSYAPNIGEYNITFASQNDNISILNCNFTLYIINRPTLLNGTTDINYFSLEYFIFNVSNVTFTYIDELSGNLISAAQNLGYTIRKLDDLGNLMFNETITGILYEKTNGYYLLDLDNENLGLGQYSIDIYLKKDNYEPQFIKIFFTIKKREMSYLLSTKEKITLGSGKPLRLKITLLDPNNDSNPITGAEVYLMFKGHRYDFNYVQNGIYELRISNISKPFFFPDLYDSKIYIITTYYELEVIRLTILVKMIEIFPYVPTFVFLLIVMIGGAIGGSFLTHRVIQIVIILKYLRNRNKRILKKNQNKGNVLGNKK